MLYIEGIKSGLDQGLRHEIISRKIFTSYPTFVFDGLPDLQFEILNQISNEFKVPITAVQITGSAKTGESYINKTTFKKGESDLDIAIVDPILFQKYSELVIKETAGFTDLTGFKDYDYYKKNIIQGFFRPDLMPTCEARKKWFNFFSKLSVKYSTFFSDINAGIYFSQTFFEFKQMSNIDIVKRIYL